MIATAGTVGLAEWIIDGTVVLFPINMAVFFFNSQEVSIAKSTLVAICSEEVLSRFLLFQYWTEQKINQITEDLST